MAIALEYINFIVPIAVIQQKYAGGWEKFKKDIEHLIGGRIWFDAHLLRDGAMNPYDIAIIVDRWKGMGFQPTEEVNGQLVWKDCCVVGAGAGQATAPCDWLEIGGKGYLAYLKGTKPGRVVGCDVVGGITVQLRPTDPD